MLGHTYRYHVWNPTGVTMTCTVKARDFKFASDGSRTDAAESTPMSAVAVTTASYGSGSTVDNSTTKNLGADLLFTASPGSSGATGVVTLYLQRSTDGGTTWPANGQGQPLCAIAFNSAPLSPVTANATVR